MDTESKGAKNVENLTNFMVCISFLHNEIILSMLGQAIWIKTKETACLYVKNWRNEEYHFIDILLRVTGNHLFPV
jgi:hypothetical protein